MLASCVVYIAAVELSERSVLTVVIGRWKKNVDII